LVAHHAKSTRVQGADLVMKSNAAGRRFFFPLRSREAVGLRREESLFASFSAAATSGRYLAFLFCPISLHFLHSAF